MATAKAFTIRITGLDKAVKSLSTLDRIKIPLAIKGALETSSRFVLRTLIENTPVDTGNLALSENIMSEGSSKVMIGPDTEQADYAYYVEYGHHTVNGGWVPGQHFIQKTAIETREGVTQIFNQYLKKAV